MEQIVDYKNDPGNGYTRTLLCFIQLFIVSNRTETIYFANNNARHFAFDADERYLPVYRFADKENKPINHLDDFVDRFLQTCELGRMISVNRCLLPDFRPTLAHCANPPRPSRAVPANGSRLCIQPLELVEHCQS